MKETAKSFSSQLFKLIQGSKLIQIGILFVLLSLGIVMMNSTKFNFLGLSFEQPAIEEEIINE